MTQVTFDGEPDQGEISEDGKKFTVGRYGGDSMEWYYRKRHGRRYTFDHSYTG